MNKQIRNAAIGLLLVYSVALAVIEVCTSQDYVRNYFTDITGDVAFYAVNTSLSVFLLWGTALLFGVAFALANRAQASAVTQWFLAGQVLVFVYLGLDDRFMIHEKLGALFDVGDHYILGLVAAAELAMLGLWGRRVLPATAWPRLVLAGVLFAIMIVFDAIVPHDMVLRLSLEDIAKVWACVMFLAYAWDALMHTIDSYAEQARASVEEAVLGRTDGPATRLEHHAIVEAT